MPRAAMGCRLCDDLLFDCHGV